MDSFSAIFHNLKEKLNAGLSGAPDPPLHTFGQNSSLDQGRTLLADIRPFGKTAREKETLDHRLFLSSRVQFDGRNVPLAVRKACAVARVLIEQPKLLLLSEEALDFGEGITANFRFLERRLQRTTIVSITHRNDNLHAYNKVILMDGGTVIDHGEPAHLLANPKSFFHIYLKETDKKALRQQSALLGLGQVDQTRMDSGSKGLDFNGSQKDTSRSRLKEPLFSNFRQRDIIENSPRSRSQSPSLPVTGKKTATDRKPQLPKRQRSSSMHQQTYLAREASLLLKEMCDQENDHRANQMFSRVLGGLSSSRSIFGSLA